MVNFKAAVLVALFGSVGAGVSAMTEAQAQAALDRVDAFSCFDGPSDEYAECVNEQIELCEVDLSEASFYQRACSNVVFEQTDEVLNQRYQYFIEDMKRHDAYRAANNFARGDKTLEDFLREGQRAWIVVRDTTCHLGPTYDLISSGYYIGFYECAAEMTARRLQMLVDQIDRPSVYGEF